METWNVILGVDVSKLTLDICCAERKLHKKIDNGSQGFADLKKWCKINSIDLKDTLMVLEYTGGYEYRFLQFCESLSIPYCRLPGLEIKLSMGMKRGKSDKADAFRISEYGQEKSSKLSPSKPLNKNIIKLKQLLAFRKRLVRDKAGYEVTVKERKHMFSSIKGDKIQQVSKRVVKAHEKEIETIAREIRELIKGDDEVSKNFRIITSIKGIGEVNGWMTIAYTENFTSFSNPRQYGVYAGVIPFENTSGTSKRGRRRISQMANKEIKSDLNQAAKSAIAYDPQIRSYADRKLKNKDYKLVLNNIKFKLILRMFALVKRGELFVENYQRVA